jgi:hypothetical protein
MVRQILSRQSIRRLNPRVGALQNVADRDYQNRVNAENLRLENENAQKLSNVLSGFNSYKFSTGTDSLFDRPPNQNYIFNGVNVPFYSGVYKELKVLPTGTVQVITRESKIKEWRKVGSQGNLKPFRDIQVLNVEEIPIGSQQALDIVNRKLINTPQKGSFSQDFADNQRAQIEGKLATTRKIESLISATGNKGKISVLEVKKNPALFNQLQTKVSGGYQQGLATKVKQDLIKRGLYPSTISGLNRTQVNALGKSKFSLKSLRGLAESKKKVLVDTVTDLLDSSIRVREKERVMKKLSKEVNKFSLNYLNQTLKTVQDVKDINLERFIDYLNKSELQKTQERGFTSIEGLFGLLFEKSEEQRKAYLSRLARGIAVSRVGKDGRRYVIKVNDDGDIVEYVYDIKKGITLKRNASKLLLGELGLSRGSQKIIAERDSKVLLKKIESYGKQTKDSKGINILKDSVRFVRAIANVFGFDGFVKLGKARLKVSTDYASLFSKVALSGINKIRSNQQLTPSEFKALKNELFSGLKKLEDTKKRDINKLIRDKDVQQAFLIVLLMVVTAGGSAIVNSLSKIGTITNASARVSKFIRFANNRLPFLGGVGRTGKIIIDKGLVGAEAVFTAQALSEFRKNPTPENLAELLLFGVPTYRNARTGFSILRGKTKASVKNLKEGTKTIEEILVLANTDLKIAEKRLNSLQRGSKERKKLVREITQKRYLYNTLKEDLKFQKKLARDSNIIKNDDYSDIINSKEQRKHIRKLVDLYHTTPASFSKLFGQEINRLAKSKDELIAYAKGFSKPLLIGQKRNISYKPSNPEEKIIFDLFKKEGVVLSGAKAMNLQVKKGFRRATSDIDAKALKNNSYEVIKKAERRLNNYLGFNKYKAKQRVALGGKVRVSYLEDLKTKDSVLEISNIKDKDKRQKFREFTYVMTKDGLLVETQASLLLNKVGAILEPRRFSKKGKVDIKDFIALSEGKANLSFFKKYKSPKNIMEIISALKLSGVGTERMSFFKSTGRVEDQLFFSLNRIFSGYGKADISKKPFFKYIIDGLIGKNKYNVLRLKGVKIPKYPPHLLKLIKRGEKGLLTPAQSKKLRVRLVDYINKKTGLFLGTKTSALGTGEEEAVITVGRQLINTKKKSYYYDPEINQIITILDVTLKSNKVNQTQKKLLTELKSASKVSGIDKFILRLTNPDITQSRAIRRAIKLKNLITKSQKDSLFNILKRYKNKLTRKVKSKVIKLIKSLKNLPNTIRKVTIKKINNYIKFLRTMKASLGKFIRSKKAQSSLITPKKRRTIKRKIKKNKIISKKTKKQKIIKRKLKKKTTSPRRLKPSSIRRSLKAGKLGGRFKRSKRTRVSKSRVRKPMTRKRGTKTLTRIRGRERKLRPKVRVQRTRTPQPRPPRTPLDLNLELLNLDHLELLNLDHLELLNLDHLELLNLDHLELLNLDHLELLNLDHLNLNYKLKRKDFQLGLL